MAVDTRNKRMSMIGLASPVPRLWPSPDGSLAANADRQMMLFRYAGIIAESVAVVPTYTATAAIRLTATTEASLNS